MKSIFYATMTTAVLTPIITIWSELNSGVKDLFTSIGTHHWVGKGIVLAVVWVLVAAILHKTLRSEELSQRQMGIAIGTHIVSALVIVAFFLVES